MRLESNPTGQDGLADTSADIEEPVGLPPDASPGQIFDYWNRVRPMPWGLPKPPSMEPETDAPKTEEAAA